MWIFRLDWLTSYCLLDDITYITDTHSEEHHFQKSVCFRDIRPIFFFFFKSATYKVRGFFLVFGFGFGVSFWKKCDKIAEFST